MAATVKKSSMSSKLLAMVITTALSSALLMAVALLRLGNLLQSRPLLRKIAVARARSLRLFLRRNTMLRYLFSRASVNQASKVTLATALLTFMSQE